MLSNNFFKKIKIVIFNKNLHGVHLLVKYLFLVLRFETENNIIISSFCIHVIIFFYVGLKKV